MKHEIFYIKSSAILIAVSMFMILELSVCIYAQEKIMDKSKKVEPIQRLDKSAVIDLRQKSLHELEIDLRTNKTEIFYLDPIWSAPTFPILTCCPFFLEVVQIVNIKNISNFDKKIIK
jgi:hypothetical protein